MKKVIEWLKTSNRWKHLIFGMLIGILSNSIWCATLAGAGVASALEYKDKAWGGKWDWVDWGLTIAGVIVGFTLKFTICLDH